MPFTGEPPMARVDSPGDVMKKNQFGSAGRATPFGRRQQRAQKATGISTNDLESVFGQGRTLHGIGHLAEAEKIYRQVLKAQPNHRNSLYLLGVVYYQRGHYEEAVRQFGAALKIDSTIVGAYATRGIALQKLGRFGEAVESYDRATTLSPNDAITFHNRGNALQELQRFDEAVGSYDQAIALKSDYAGAFYNRGNALAMLKRFDEAVASYDRTVTLNPGYADALNNRGAALQKLGRFDEAAASHQRATALAPDDASAFYNLGSALHELKRFQEAVTSYDRAIALKPGFANAFFRRGHALHALRRFDLAMENYDHAIALRPDYAEAFNNRGATLKELKRTEEALASCDRAVALKPDYADALNNRGTALQELKRFEEAVESYSRAVAVMPGHKFAFSGLADCAIKMCEWPQCDELSGQLRQHVLGRKSEISPFLLLGYSDDASIHLSCARNYILDRTRGISDCLRSTSIWRNEKIKVAYISSDFRAHPLSFLMAELFELHDRSRFEVVGVSLGPDDRSDARARVAAAFDQFIDVRSKSDKEVVQLLKDFRVDIAVDLNGHTQGARTGILAARAAPIQVSYMGFPATMGADFIDYIIADATVIPFDEQCQYTECIVHLPHSYMVNDRKRAISLRTPTREEPGLPVEGFVFCCFNNNWKITSKVFDIWMRLLKRIDGSVLWLFRDNHKAEANLRKEAAAREVDPARLVFADRLPVEDHLARHRLADLVLDTLPYNAHTTASDALWSGLPVLTCRGRTFAGRVGASLLNAVGLSELVTSDLGEYEAMALRLATDRPLLHGFRERLERNRLSSPLFDSDRFCQHIESAYTIMWDLWQRGEPPRAFGVEAFETNRHKAAATDSRQVVT